MRGVEKAHARLAREANKAADDMRARRMEALKVLHTLTFQCQASLVFCADV